MAKTCNPPRTPARARRSSTKPSMRSPSSSARRAAARPSGPTERRPRRDMDVERPVAAYVEAGTLAHRWLRRMAEVTVCTSCSSRVTGERSRCVMVGVGKRLPFSRWQCRLCGVGVVVSLSTCLLMSMSACRRVQYLDVGSSTHRDSSAPSAQPATAARATEMEAGGGGCKYTWQGTLHF